MQYICVQTPEGVNRIGDVADMWLLSLIDSVEKQGLGAVDIGCKK